jgi:hypothetical protein
MQFSTMCFIIGAAAVGSVQAGCFSGGEVWGGEQGLADQAIDDLCDPAKHTSFTREGFSAGQTKAECYTLSGDKKADFSVNYGGQGTTGLAQADCVLRFKNEIDGCGNGGSTTTADWTFTYVFPVPLFFSRETFV